MASLNLKGLRKSFGQELALADVSLSIKSGEFICLLGESGCGKTTLLRQIAGLDIPDAGSITLEGTDLLSIPCHERNIGMVFQSLALFPHLTVKGNVSYALDIRGVDKKTRHKEADKLLDMVGLSEFGDRKISQLSGGQKQRVAIARALATEPSLFLMDEPFSALDAGLREHLQIEIRKLQKSLGITTIFVTHDQREAMAVADRIVVLNNGRIEQAGTPTEIYSQPKSAFVANFIGDNNILDVSVHDGEMFFNSHALGKVEMENGKYKIAIRPEHLTLRSASQNKKGVLATVTLVRSLGAFYETELRVADTTLVQTSLTSADLKSATVGDERMVAFDLSKLWVLPS